jgi:hypothetical protein
LGQPVLILPGKNKTGAESVFALDRLAAQNADAAGFVSAEEHAAGLLATIGKTTALLDFQPDPIQHCGGTLDLERALGNMPLLGVSVHAG